MSFAQELKFSDLTRMLDAVSSASDAKKREKFMSDYFKLLLNFQADYKKKNQGKDSSLFPVLRLIVANEEKERAYGLQEKSLKQLYIKALRLGKDNKDAIKIAQCSEDNLHNVIYETIKSRTTMDDVGSLSVQDVDNALNSFSENSKQSAQEIELSRLIQQSSSLDQKWLVKIILKRKMDLRLGLAKIFRLWHPRAHDLFMKFPLSQVSEIVESGQAEKAMMEVCEVFSPMKAMLSQKFNEKVNRKFSGMFAETKMDGERFQLHMKDGVFRYYSRNLHEFSDGYNELISPLIKFKSVVHSVIFDGEMLVYDKTQRRYISKGETEIDVKHMKGGKFANLRPCFCVFDVLFLNGQSFLNRPYLERHQVLEQLFEDREGVLVKTKPIKVRNIDHIAELFNKAIDKEEEGIILKDENSIYVPGERTGGWFKVKADYFDGDIVHDFDCIVIGGYFNNAHKRDFIRRYMLGVVEKKENGSFNVYACGEVVHGVKVQERLQLHKTLQPHLVDHCGETEIPFARGKIVFGRNKPDVWIVPDKSVVLECRVSELAKSSEYYTNYTFRFPRIEHVRRDKIWDEACTLKEFEEMYERSDGKVQKVVKRNVKAADIISPSRKRKAASSKSSIVEKFCHNSQDLEEVETVDNALEGKEFCVLSTGPKLPSIKAMKVMVRKHGGTIVEFPRKDKTFALIVGEMTKMVKGFMRHSASYNVIKADWLVQHFGGEQVFKEMPKIRPVIDLIFTTEALKESLKDIYDEFGDSFTEEQHNDEQFQKILQSMKNVKSNDDDLLELEVEMSNFGRTNFNFFRNVSGSFFSLNKQHFLMKSAESVFKLRAGKVFELSDNQDGKIIFVDAKEDIEEVKRRLEKVLMREAECVDFRWILSSSDAGKKLEMNSYTA